MRWLLLLIFFTSCTPVPHYNLLYWTSAGQEKLLKQELEKCKDEVLLHMSKYVNHYYRPTIGRDAFSGMYTDMLQKCTRTCVRQYYRVQLRTQYKSHKYAHIFLKLFSPTCK